MKTAEELAAEIEHGLIWHQHEFKAETGKVYLPFVIRQIQLDAMKEGARRAAERLWPESTDLCYGEDINYITRLKNKRTAELKQAILTAAEQ